MGLYDFTIYDLICRNAVIFGNSPAWFEADNGRTLTFAQLKDHVDRLAYGLQQSNINKGDRIGVLGKNSLEYFLLYGAAAAIGAVMLPINWRLSKDEVHYNLADGAPAVVFVEPEFAALVQGSKFRSAPETTCFSLAAPSAESPTLQELLNNTGEFSAVEVANDDAFVIIHTAAVAGKPRGAVLSHRNLICAGLHLNCCLNMTPADVHLNLLPLFHIGGLMMVVGSFQAGALNVNMSKFDAQQAARLIEEKKVSLMFDFSPILGSILEEHQKSGRDIRTLRAVMGLEAPETIEKYQQLTEGTFYCLYGQTETTGMATVGRYNDRPGSAGKIIPLANVRLINEYDRPVQPGQTGEIAVKGPLIFKGYWNLPEENAYTFREGWHHTGDLGRFDADGFLWYAGRKPEKELIKPGGENVYPAEVEKVILQHPAIAKTAVFGVPDPKWKEGIKAVCQLKPGHKLMPKDLIDFVGERIARYKKPQYVEFIVDFPCLEDGTPDRAKIKEQFGENR